MSDREALLAAVIASPDDDVPRLVYADYLDDLGGKANVSRAAFIRAEIAAELLPADDPQRERLETAAAGLFNRFGEAWDAELKLPPWLESQYRLTYRRGFAGELAVWAEAAISCDLFLVTAPFRTLQLLPGPERPTFPAGCESRASDRPTWAFGCGDLSRISTFRLGPNFDLAALTERIDPRGWLTGFFVGLFNEPTLTAVTCLDLAGNRVNNAALEIALGQLRTAPIGTTLVVLDLSDNVLTDAGLAYLAAARGLDRVTTVHVRGNPVTPAGVDALRGRFGDGVVA